MLARLDAFLLDQVAQKFSDWFNDLTGKSCFWLAKVCVLPTPLYLLFRACYGGNVVLMAISVLVLAVLGIYVVFWDRAEKYYEGGQNARVVNPKRNFLPWGIIRTLVLGLSLDRLVEFTLHCLYGGAIKESLLDLFLFMLFVAAWYFEACTPKPRSPLRAGNKLAWSAR